MANTITLSLTVSVKDGSGGVSMQGTDSVAQTGSNYSKLTQVITAAVPVKLVMDPAILDGNLGFLTVRNLAAKVAGALPADQPYIDLASDAGMTNKLITIQPAISHFIQPPNGTINVWAQAHGADVQATVMAIET